MMITGTFPFYKAIIINEYRLKELEVITAPYYEDIIYKGTSIIGEKIEFTSLDEVLAYDNYKNHKLMKLIIIGYVKDKRSFHIVFSNTHAFYGHQKSAVAEFCINTLDEKILFERKMIDYFSKIKADYWLIRKLTTSLISFCPFIIIIMKIVFNYSYIMANLISYQFFMVAVFTLFFILNMFLKTKLFPSIVFMLGEEIHIYNKWSKLRSNLIWVVIMGFIINMISTYIYDLISFIAY